MAGLHDGAVWRCWRGESPGSSAVVYVTLDSPEPTVNRTALAAGRSSRTRHCSPQFPDAYWTRMAERPIDEDLELYALNRLPEAAAAPIEEHLLVCEECCGRLSEWDRYIAAMRAAMRRKDTPASGRGGFPT